MRPAALHDKQRMVLLARLRIVPDRTFPAHPAFHESPEFLSAEHYPQAGFPAVPYEDDPAQTVSLRGIFLPAAHTRVALAPAAWVSVCFAAVLVLVECASHPRTGVAHFLPLVWSLWDVVPAPVRVAVLLQHPLQLVEHTHVVPAPVVWAPVRSVTAAIPTVCAEHLHIVAAFPTRGMVGQTAPAAHLRKNPLKLYRQDAGLRGAVAGWLHGRFRGRSFLPVRSLCVLHCLVLQSVLCCHSAPSQTSAPSGAARSMQLAVSAVCFLDGQRVHECLK